jgi:hypothetical protein
MSSSKVEDVQAPNSPDFSFLEQLNQVRECISSVAHLQRQKKKGKINATKNLIKFNQSDLHLSDEQQQQQWHKQRNH